MKNKKLYLISALLVALGIIVFTVGFWMMEFNPRNFDTEPPFIERSFVPENKVSSIDITDKNANINITTSKDNKLRIKYYENVNETYVLTEADGIITIEKKELSGFFDTFLDFSQSTPLLTIELPQKWDGSIDISHKEGNVTASDATMKNLNAKVKNGNIRLSNLTVSGHADVEATGGEIRIYDIEVKKTCTALSKNGELFAWSLKTDDLYVTANNSLLTLAYVNADTIFAESNKKDIKLSCIDFSEDAHILSTSGNIVGTFMGTEADFTYYCSAPEGECNLADKVSQGDKNLHIKTEKGNIEIDFNAPVE